MKLLPILVLLILVFGCTAPQSQQPAGPSQNYTPPAQPPAETQPPPQQTGSQEPAQPPPQPPAQPPAQPPPASGLESREISYSSDAWKIYGTLYESKNPSPTKLIILAHELGKDRNSYPPDIIKRLHDELPDALVLAIDMRGHGKSTNLGSYTGFDMATSKSMRSDILSAKTPLVPSYPTLKNIYVVGASMGSTAALLAGEQEKWITKVVMISPGMEYQNVSIKKSFEDYVKSLLVVAASGDSYSAQAVSEIKSLTPASQTESQLYSGSAHGTALFDATKNDAKPLSDVLVEFLK